MNKNTQSSKKALPIVLAGVLVILILATVIVTLSFSRSDTILPGVHVAGVDLSGLTKEEAEPLISEAVSQVKNNEIKIVADNDSFSATYSDLGASYDCRLSAENAYNYGHSGFFSSIGPAVKAIFGVKVDLDLHVYINNRVFDSAMSNFTDYDKSVQASYELIDGAIRVTNGVNAYSINPVVAKEAIGNAMKKLDFSTIVLAKEDLAPIPLDIETLLDDHSKEAVSATYFRDADGNIMVTEGSDKITADKGKAKELIKANSAPGQVFDIPAQIDFAQHTYDELTEALFRDVLGEYSTSYASSNANRSHNVALAASSVNDKILLPGESLSYNDTLGKRTPEAGYKLAGAYSNGQTVQEYGGGICQVSSTVYIAVLKSNLKIDERTCHMFRVGYVPMGLDATVDYGTVDFVFSNDTEYPIKISCITTENKQVICKVYGTKLENFEVTFETTGISAVPFTTEIEEDPTLPVGTEEIVEEGSNGSRCTVYRVVSVDGEVVSRTKESQSYYLPHNEIKKVGTMPVEGTEAISPEIVTPEGTAPAVPADPTNPTTPEAPVAPEVQVPEEEPVRHTVGSNSRTEESVPGISEF